jgi:CheY-like chemotaxis protein
MTPTEHRHNTEKCRVLFVGTPQVDLEETVCSSCNYPVTVDVVSDGRKAIQWLTEASETTDHHLPDLIVLEFGFESPDGDTVLCAIKSSPHLGTVPVIVLTADETDAETAYEHGGNAHITAPRSAEAYTELARSIGQFWFEWVKYPSESLSADDA